MKPSRGLIAIFVLAILAAGSAAVALALPSTHGGSSAAPLAGPGMMGGYGSAGVTGSTSAIPLRSVRSRVESWLDSRGFRGFRVAEVMAFSNNDYVAVRDRRGRPAFELLTTPSLSWLMEEPPSMMWNSRYGAMRGFGRSWSQMGSMMGGYNGAGWNSWYRTGHGPITTIRGAVRLADRWLAHTHPGERVDPDVGGMGHFPGYYTLDTLRSGKTVGMLSVDATSGAVWYHGWHGRFLREQEF